MNKGDRVEVLRLMIYGEPKVWRGGFVFDSYEEGTGNVFVRYTFGIFEGMRIRFSDRDVRVI